MLQVDENAFTRKQGLFVLEHATKHVAVPAGQGWQALVHALALLEDFALHLIQVRRPTAHPSSSPQVSLSKAQLTIKRCWQV